MSTGNILSGSLKMGKNMAGFLMLAAFGGVVVTFFRPFYVRPINSLQAAQTELLKQEGNCLREKQPDFQYRVSMRGGGEAYYFKQLVKPQLQCEGECNSSMGDGEAYFLPSRQVIPYADGPDIYHPNFIPIVYKGEGLSDKQRETFDDIRVCESLTLPMPQDVKAAFEACATKETGMPVEMMGGLPTMNIAVGPATRPDEQAVYSYRWTGEEYKTGAENKSAIDKLKAGAAVTDPIRIKLDGCMNQVGITGMVPQ